MQTQPWAHTTSASALIKAFDILEELNILLVGIQHIGPYILHVTGLNTVVTGSDSIGHHFTKTSKGFRVLLRLSLGGEGGSEPYCIHQLHGIRRRVPSSLQSSRG